MIRYRSRAVRWTLALALPALAACVDEPSSPTAVRLRPAMTVVPQDTFVVTSKAGDKSTGTLRWAVSQAHMGDIIRFAPVLAGDTIVIDTTVTLPSFMTIEGPRDRGITISGGRRVLVMRVLYGANLRNLAIKDGNGFSAGGILSNGPLTLESVTVWKNQSPATSGIFADTLTLINSTVTLNDAQAGGAGGISYARRGMLTLINSTIAYNAPARGLAPYGDATDTPKVTLVNSIIARNGNGMSHFDCYDTAGFTYVGVNIADDPSCGQNAGMVVLDPRLELPANNGGPTLTVGLSPQSGAINAGSSCSVATDQRFLPRDGQCDIGAFEFTDFTAVTITIDPTATVGTTGSAVVTGTIRCSRGGDQFGLRVTLQQQKGGKTPTTVQGLGGAAVTCSVSAQPWRATLTASSGAFDTGTGTASAATNDVPIWITPTAVSASVKLARPRK